MRTQLYVISDLHLGGAERFQMCPEPGRERLAEFIRWISAGRTESHDVHLVVNGDIVDFLAEKHTDGGYLPFIPNEAAALDTLERILDTTDVVWRALAGLLSKGCALTLLLGNHDIELSFPALRRHLVRRLGNGRIEFIFDNEAYRRGPLLIEHGNRYDPFNVVAHDSLRRVRSSMSRGEPYPGFRVQPGSELVAKVMNEIKEDYSFVDLLKPETAGVLPILAALNAGTWRRARQAIYRLAQATHNMLRYDSQGNPTEDDFVAGRVHAGAVSNSGDDDLSAPNPGARARFVEDLPDQDAFVLADELARLAAEGDDRIAHAPDIKEALLLRAFRKRREKDATTFDTTVESPTYLRPATMAIDRRFHVVVYGHTHLAKRIGVGHGVYLNSGTWADLMRVPESILMGDEQQGRKALRRFLDDLRNNRILQLRRQVATFARVVLDESDRIEESDVFFYDGDGHTDSISTQGFLRRLDVVEPVDA